MTYLLLLVFFARSEILISAPRQSDDYYRSQYKNIISFQRDLIAKLSKHHKVVVFADEKARSELGPPTNQFKYSKPMQDIWIRDYSPVYPKKPHYFRYTPGAQGGDAQVAKDVQLEFRNTYRPAIKQLPYFLDGGNFVFEDSRAVITNKFLTKNKLTVEKARNIFLTHLGINHLAISESDDHVGLAHSDGMVSFLEKNVLLVNGHSAPFMKRNKGQLSKSLPGIQLVELPYHPSNKSYDNRFSSACGIYTNILVTSKVAIVPIFKHPSDQKALSIVRSLTSKKVLPIDASKVCKMGGSVRCLTAQM